jgi:hypothetical protein
MASLKLAAVRLVTPLVGYRMNRELLQLRNFDLLQKSNTLGKTGNPWRQIAWESTHRAADTSEKRDQ